MLPNNVPQCSNCIRPNTQQIPAHRDRRHILRLAVPFMRPCIHPASARQTRVADARSRGATPTRLTESRGAPAIPLLLPCSKSTSRFRFSSNPNQMLLSFFDFLSIQDPEQIP
jgi:hypothetical protein